MADRVLLSIGTRKGVFVAESSSRRNRFELRGPFGQGVGVYTTMIDTRSTPRVYASSCNAFSKSTSAGFQLLGIPAFLASFPSPR